MTERLRVLIEQAIARGESDAHITASLGVSTDAIARVRGYLDRVLTEPDTVPAPPRAHTARPKPQRHREFRRLVDLGVNPDCARVLAERVTARARRKDAAA